MFADVSAETQAELKRVHKESQGIKFWVKMMEKKM